MYGGATVKKRIQFFPTNFVKDAIKVLRKSRSREEAWDKLQKKYMLNDKQLEYLFGDSIKKLIEEKDRDYKDLINGLIELD